MLLSTSKEPYTDQYKALCTSKPFWVVMLFEQLDILVVLLYVYDHSEQSFPLLRVRLHSWSLKCIQYARMSLPLVGLSTI